MLVNNMTLLFCEQVHDSAVILMACNSKENQVISTSNGKQSLDTSVYATTLQSGLLHTDNCIHVTRLYPYAQEALSPMTSFYVTSCPSLLSVTPDRVGVACNDHAHSCYSIDMFCLQDKGLYTTTLLHFV